MHAHSRARTNSTRATAIQRRRPSRMQLWWHEKTNLEKGGSRPKTIQRRIHAAWSRCRVSGETGRFWGSHLRARRFRRNHSQTARLIRNIIGASRGEENEGKNICVQHDGARIARYPLLLRYEPLYTYLYIYTIHTHSFLLYLSYHEHTFCDAIVLYGFLTHVVSRLLRGLSYSSDKPSSSGKLFFSANFKHSCCLYIRATRKMWPLRGALCSYKIFKHSQ